MRLFSCLLALTILASLTAGTPDTSAPAQRLGAVGRLWSRVKWTHPALAQGDVDWDRALVQALPAIQGATTPQELTTALQALMAPLKDPALRVGASPVPLAVEVPTDQATVTWLPGDVALLHLHRRGPLSPWNPKQGAAIKDLEDALPRAKALLFDLRPAAQEGPASGADAFLKGRLKGLIGDPLRLPAARYRYHSGFKPEIGVTSGGYFSGLLSMESEVILPSKQAKPLPMAFLVNEGSGVPYAALALQRAGKAWIVGEGQPSAAWVIPTEAIQIEGDVTLEFSTAELVQADGSFGFGVDATVPPSPNSGPETPSVLAALKLIQGGPRPGGSISWHPATVLPLEGNSEGYPASIFPDLPWRQLAVIKFWSVVDCFFPYKALMDQPWEDALTRFLERMQTVKDGREYALTLAEMATLLQDSHVGVRNSEMSAYLGQSPTLARLAHVEGQIAVTAIDPVGTPGLAVGDIVLRVDGEEAQQRLQRLRRVLPASTEHAGIRVALSYLLCGPDGSTAHVEVKGVDGQTKSVDLPRSLGHWTKLRSKRSGPVIQTLPGNVVYADLDRLEPKDVDALFETAKQAPALVLDMRGYPNGTAWPIAPRLNVKGAKVGASFRRNLLAALPFQRNLYLAFDQSLPTTDKAPYRGKVVMLINEDTISQAEHTGLFFESACEVTFVGSPTTGANGDVTVLALPGDIRVSFTGHDVRHADGRQLQRVGLQPHIRAVPTLAGLQRGKDEVLDRALAFLKTGH